MKFFKLLIDDLLNKEWPEGTTLDEKNSYRAKVAGLMAALAAGAFFFISPYLAIVPALVAIRKVWIILEDNG